MNSISLNRFIQMFDFDLFDDFEQQLDDMSVEFPGFHWVDSYVKSDGTFVQGHMKTLPDEFVFNNLSFGK